MSLQEKGEALAREFKDAAYHVYVKVPGRKRFYPLGEDIDGNLGPVPNLLNAFLYVLDTPEKIASMEKYVAELNAKEGLTAELRKVKTR